MLILLLGPVSGAHFNPVVTLADWFSRRRDPDGLALRDVAAYILAQITGAIGGAVLADAMFAKPLVRFSTHDRSAGHLLLAETVATAGPPGICCWPRLSPRPGRSFDLRPRHRRGHRGRTRASPVPPAPRSETSPAAERG
ncbi:hypothetical protein SHKM778_45140 [Streptomyces sp. KM77-8]|uniref:Aquaporin family protein n=1 Tax=Streptomyces haneummycinicus TaxID=3074435 RepID=A0AAT9HLB9_9ACTN